MNYKLIYLPLNLAGIMAFVAGAVMTDDVMNVKLLISCAIFTALNSIRLLSEKNAKTKQHYGKKTSIPTD